MSHVVLARKYRPRSFEQMVGQPHVVQALSNALKSGRLHHAYLFTGTRGIGKTTVSRILAKSLNCMGLDGQGGVTDKPCGECQACKEIDADRYIDYIELDAASNRSIDEIRDLIERAAYKPSVGRFKVFMIDEAHQLTKDAFNALLKTLEEPPDYLKFVLATTDPEKMLPTVLSRCLQFNLRPMAPETVLAHLQKVLEAENVPSDADALRLLSRAARGSMRDALSLTDQAIAYGAGTVKADAVRAMLGTVDRGHAERLVAALAQRDGAAVLAHLAELRDLGLSPAGTLEEMALLLQQMAVEQVVPGGLDEQNPDTAPARALAGAMAADECQLLYSIVLNGRAELGLLNDEHAALTMVLLRFLAFPAAGEPAPAAPPPPRAAPLVATPGVARSSAPANGPANGPAIGPANGPGIVAAPLSARVAAPRGDEPRPRPAAKAGHVAESEPPPWIDDGPPDDDDGPVPIGAPVRANPASSISPPLGRPDEPIQATPAALLTTDLGQQWHDLLRPLIDGGQITALVRELALQAELVAVSAAAQGGLEYRLRVERETLAATSLVDKLASAMQAALGEPVGLVIERGNAQDSMARRGSAAREAAQREAEQLISQDPQVRSVLTTFAGARIVPGSVKPVAANAAD